jgi:hypothetical protein
MKNIKKFVSEMRKEKFRFPCLSTLFEIPRCLSNGRRFLQSPGKSGMRPKLARRPNTWQVDSVIIMIMIQQTVGHSLAI